jgi:SlyX protein
MRDAETNKMLSAHMADLETQLAFQDDLLDQLNAVISRQDLQLRDLERRLQRLEDSLQQLSRPAERIDLPPHY